jgi:hypothetical protein
LERINKMGKLIYVLGGAYRLLVKYPAVAAGLANIAVVMAATFGFKLSADQVVTAVSFTAGVTALLVHAGVIPVYKANKGQVSDKVKQAVNK